MRVIFSVIGEHDRCGPDPVAELDVLPRFGDTVSMPGGLQLTTDSVTHHPFGDSRSSSPYAVVLVH